MTSKILSPTWPRTFQVYSKEMNHIREDLTRLRTDRERYQKQDEAHKKAMKLSSMSASTSTDHLPEHSLPITRSDAMQQLRQHNNINNKLLNDKVCNCIDRSS